MRLPADKTERTKILVLIGLGTVAAIYTVAIGVVRPLKTKRQERNDEIATVKEQLDGAERQVGRMMKNRNENTKILREIIAMANSQKSVLQPRLGNYLLEARDFLEAHARVADVEIASIREVGIMQLPKSKLQINDNAVKAYNSQVQMNGGLHDLIRFLRQIEVSNPFIVVSSLSVSASDRTPGNHAITFDLQWPVWADSEMARKLETRLDEMMEFKVPGERPKVSAGKPRT